MIEPGVDIRGLSVAAAHAAKRYAREGGALSAEGSGDGAADAASQEARTVIARASAMSNDAGPLQTRAQALHQLRTVADFFRRTEPHSPVAYLADKAPGSTCTTCLVLAISASKFCN